jgi:small subunit ribosomal protein SAe
VLQLRGDIARDAPWDVMVDLFMYRDPEAKKAIETAVDADGEDEGEEAQDDAAVQNTMKTFEGEGAGEEDEGDEEGEAWGAG